MDTLHGGKLSAEGAKGVIDTYQIIWSVLTFSLSRCTSARQVYIIRFFVGMFKSSLLRSKVLDSMLGPY